MLSTPVAQPKHTPRLEAFAVENAREEFQAPKRRPAADSHWNYHDDPKDRYGMSTAVCGQRVHESQISGNPTCERCQQFLAAQGSIEV